MVETIKEVKDSFKLVDVNYKYLHPMTIDDNFVTLFSFHHAQMERIIKGKSVTFTEKVPIIVIWNGKEISYARAKHNDKIDIGKEEYIIDREVDAIYPFLPSEKFVTEMVSPGFHNTIKSFKPQDLFEAVFKYFEYYFYMESQMLYKLVSLFAINQCVFDAYESTPYLFIRSPLEECGKTRVGVSIQQMWNGIISTHLKAHHVFRIVHGCSPTFIFDEAKGWSKRSFTDDKIQDMLSVINSGYQREGGQVIRFKEKGGQFGNMEAVFFDTYSPKVIITTHLSIPRDTQSRCAEIIMQRAPRDGPDYADRWGQRKKGKKSKERVMRLQKIREMAALFRFKYGREIKDLAENSAWRDELDHAGAFTGIRNRHLEIFKPLVILCLKYHPEWADTIAKYITEFMEMRERIGHSPENTVLYAMRKMYQLIVSGNEWLNDDLQMIMEESESDGQIMWVTAKMIRTVIEDYDIGTVEEFGKRPESRIGMILNEFGFVGSKRDKKGNQRRIKVSRLSERCLNYLGIRLTDDYSLSQQEEMDLVCNLMKKNRDMFFDDLADEVSGKIEEDRLRSIIKHFRTIGWLITESSEGKGKISWMK